MKEQHILYGNEVMVISHVLMLISHVQMGFHSKLHLGTYRSVAY